MYSNCFEIASTVDRKPTHFVCHKLLTTRIAFFRFFPNLYVSMIFKWCLAIQLVESLQQCNGSHKETNAIKHSYDSAIATYALQLSSKSHTIDSHYPFIIHIF